MPTNPVVEYDPADLLIEVETAAMVFEHLSRLDLVPEKFLRRRHFGAYFCKTDLQGVPELYFPLGKIARLKRRAYHELAKKQCMQLARHPNDLTSRATKKGVPGAIRGSRSIRVIQGWPGLLAELGAAVWAFQIEGELTRTKAHKLLEGNDLFPKYRLGANRLID